MVSLARSRSSGSDLRTLRGGGSLLDTYLISSTAPTILVTKEAGLLYHLEIHSAPAARQAEMGPAHCEMTER